MKPIFFIFLNVFSLGVFAQGQDRNVIFSGIIIDGKNDEPLPGAVIINAQAGRGTVSTSLGNFAIHVFPGDSIVFSYLGFKKHFFKIPKNVGETFSAVVELQQDAKMLKEVKIYPYSSEEEFKDAFIAIKLPDEKARQIIEETFSNEQVAIYGHQIGMGAAANYRNFMNQQIGSFASKGQATMNPFLNPFAWAKFIKDVKGGSLKDKSWKAAANQPAPESLPRDKFFRTNTGN